MTVLSVATWNMHHAVDRSQFEASWGYLQQTVAPTVALVQEAAGFPSLDEKHLLVGPNREIDPEHFVRYDTAVIAAGSVRLDPVTPVTPGYRGATPFSLTPSVPATLAIANVSIEGIEPFIAISVYGRMAPLYAQTAMLRVIADLIPLFDTPHLKRRIVLGGDINGHTMTTNLTERRRWAAIIAAIESLGLVNLVAADRALGRIADCTCSEAFCYHVETHRHRGLRPDKFGAMNDYLFATPDLATRLESIRVWNDDPGAWRLSDHCPVVATFDL